MLITQEIFEAFLHCPTKSYLSCRPDVLDAAPNQSWQPWEESFMQNGSSRLRAAVFDCEEYTGTPAADAIKRQQYRMIFDYTALTTDLRAHLRALELVHLPGAKDRSVRQYVPIRLLSEERISTANRLLLAFDALVFSQAASTTLPPIGKLMHGRKYSMTTVLLTPLYPKVQSVIAAIYTQQASSTPPPLLLNKHCAECQYASRCRRIATDADDLSLIVKINAKERKKYHEKGIFTVTQLSYTFRPRRRSVNHRKHEYALQALAIRKKQVHVIGTPTFTTEGTPVYFDVEGDPDRSFYYCIGLRFEAGGVTVQRSHWADGPSDEGTMWTECLRTLDGIDTPRLVHYGGYETTFLRQMKKRYPNPEWTALLDQLIGSAVNLLSTIYARVYFPTYSNGLKDVARYLGFRWSEPTASGLVALAWRREWEHSLEPVLKHMLITYNAEDCSAAKLVAETLSALSRPASTNDTSVVDVSTLKREFPQRLGKADFVLPEFQQINNAARWDHQREKVYARSNKRLALVHRNAPTAGWTVPINKVVECEEERPTHCTGCGAMMIYRWGRLSRTVYDFKLTGAGIKRWVVRYTFPPLHLLAMQDDFSPICPPSQVWQYDVRLHRLPNHRTAANAKRSV
jgi:predicted RecB family nuclease